MMEILGYMFIAFLIVIGAIVLMANAVYPAMKKYFDGK